jgi:hypothetical protein
MLMRLCGGSAWTALTGMCLALRTWWARQLDGRASTHWAEKAVAWLDAGFPAARYQGGLRRVLTDKHVRPAWSVEQNFAVVEANIGTEPEFAVGQSMKID